MISVFLVDDEEVIRTGLKKFMQWEENGFTISGEAADGEEALKYITPYNTDILITDIKMPFMDGLELSREIKKRIPGVEVILLTGFDDFNYARESLRLGATDYLLKPVKPENLLNALACCKERLLNKEYYYPFTAEQKLTAAITQGNSQELIKLIENLFNSLLIQKISTARIFETLKRITIKVYNVFNKSLPENFENELRIELLTIEQWTMVQNQFQGLLSALLIDSINLKESESVQKIKQYIHTHYRDDITLKSISNTLYMNPSYISQLFKKETGEYYNDFLSRFRVEKAVELLRKTEFSIQEISNLSGFRNSKYFSQVFKLIKGTSPSSYRKNLKGRKEFE